MTNHVKIIIDSRERKLIKNMKQIDISFIVKTIPLGDILYVSGAKVLFVIERKTITDFFQSIKDERYRDQARRLRQSLTYAKPLWLVEKTKNRLSVDNRKRIDQAIINLMTRDNIPVILSNNIEDTVNKIKRIHHCIKKHRLYLCESFIESEIATCSVKKTRSNKDFLKYSMLTISGIGPCKAEAIQNKYQIMKILMEKLQKNRRKTIRKISQLQSGQKGKIGIKLANKIATCLLGNLE